jgi:AcrR family transcriptional regulator
MSAESMSAEKPQAGSRQRILAAAEDVALERGLDSATIAAVCERAGLPASSIYWHFADRDALFAEVVRTGFAQWFRGLPRVWPASTSEVCRLAVRLLDDAPEFLRIGMQLVLDRQERNAPARSCFVEIRAQIVGMLATRILDTAKNDEEAEAAEDLARLAMAFADGLLVGSMITEDWDPEPYMEIFLVSFAGAEPGSR